MSKVAGSALLKELTSARSAATVVASGCHQLITPSLRFNRLLAPCPRRALTAGDSRPIAGSSGWPRPAQSSGPPRWIARIKLVPKLTVRVRFPSPAPCSNTVAGQTNPTVSLKAGQRSFASENGTRAITRAISHLGECPWRLSVPKLTVRVRFPSLNSTRKIGCSSCSGEEFLYCVKS